MGNAEDEEEVVEEMGGEGSPNKLENVRLFDPNQLSPPDSFTSGGNHYSHSTGEPNGHLRNGHSCTAV